MRRRNQKWLGFRDAVVIGGRMPLGRSVVSVSRGLPSASSQALQGLANENAPRGIDTLGAGPWRGFLRSEKLRIRPAGLVLFAGVQRAPFLDIATVGQNRMCT